LGLIQMLMRLYNGMERPTLANGFEITI
jgi:hypothetical protein